MSRAAKNVKTSTATVFHGARRRYLSASAAARSFFWAALKRHCECDDPSMDEPGGYLCAYHRGDFRDSQRDLMRRFLGIHFGNRQL